MDDGDGPPARNLRKNSGKHGQMENNMVGGGDKASKNGNINGSKRMKRKARSKNRNNAGSSKGKIDDWLRQSENNEEESEEWATIDEELDAMKINEIENNGVWDNQEHNSGNVYRRKKMLNDSENENRSLSDTSGSYSTDSEGEGDTGAGASQPQCVIGATDDQHDKHAPGTTLEVMMETMISSLSNFKRQYEKDKEELNTLRKTEKKAQEKKEEKF